MLIVNNAEDSVTMKQLGAAIGGMFVLMVVLIVSANLIG